MTGLLNKDTPPSTPPARCNAGFRGSRIECHARFCFADAGMSSSSLTCRALAKSFRLGRTDLEILRGVEASFPRRGLSTIQGASGSGKSTLLQILGGLEKPDAGAVQWEGDSIYDWPRQKLA